MKTKILVLIVIALFTFSCKENKTEKNKEIQEVVIGSILPLTGPISAYGNNALNGQKSAIEDLNKLETDFVFKLVTADAKGSGKDAISEYRRFRNEGIDIITVATSVMSLPLLPQVKKEKVLFFPSSSHPEINRQKSKYIFRNFVTAEQEVPLILEKINNTNYKSVALLSVNDEFGNGFKTKVLDAQNKYGNLKFDLIETIEKRQTDFSILVEKLKDLQINSIIIVGYGKSAGSLVNKIREQQIDANLYASFSYLLTEANLTAKSNKGIQAISIDSKEYNLTEACDYSTIYLIGKSVIDSNSKNIDTLSSSLEKLKYFNANGIDLEINKNHDILPKVKLMELE